MKNGENSFNIFRLRNKNYQRCEQFPYFFTPPHKIFLSINIFKNKRTNSVGMNLSLYLVLNCLGIFFSHFPFATIIEFSYFIFWLFYLIIFLFIKSNNMANCNQKRLIQKLRLWIFIFFFFCLVVVFNIREKFLWNYLVNYLYFSKLFAIKDMNFCTNELIIIIFGLNFPWIFNFGGT
jgi:hypothetical protein